jgi:hypothetical protein
MVDSYALRPVLREDVMRREIGEYSHKLMSAKEISHIRTEGMACSY